MIKVGDLLTLESINSQTEEKYKCKVAEVFEDCVHIDYPVSLQTGKTVFLHNGVQFKASFLGKDGTFYYFNTVVTGKVRQPLPLIVLSFPGEKKLVRVQRRQYVRIEVAVDVAIHPKNKEFSPFTALTSDISAGGAAITLPRGIDGLKPGMVVEAWFVLPMKSGQYHYLKIPSKVVRVFQPEKTNIYRASLQFLELTQQERIHLIRFSFEKQLEMRQKENE